MRSVILLHSCVAIISRRRLCFFISGRYFSASAFGKAVVRKSGTAAAIVTWGTALGPALEAADLVGNVGVLDLRWLSPLDEDALRQIVLDANGRVVVAHEANRTGGFGAEIVARLHEMLGDRLPLKIKRVASPDVRMPAAPALAQQLLPNAEKIAAAVRAIMI